MVLQVDYPVKILEDNRLCVHLLGRGKYRKVKQVDVKYNFVRDYVSERVINVSYINTKEQLGDFLTKSFPLNSFQNYEIV